MGPKMSMMNVHHAVTEDGLYVPFETPTRIAGKKDASPPKATQCFADKNLERNVAQLLKGILTYKQLHWNMVTDRMQSSNDPEGVHPPKKCEVTDEYARTLAHARTCATCLIKYGDEVSTNHLKILGIMELPATTH